MSKKLLLADDSVTIQKVVELLLSDENFEIKSVNNGEEAWSIIKEYNPDIVLADIEMPNMNGYQLCEKIKNDESLSHIPVILLAGAFEPLDEELARDVRADDYLVKPFESQELISKLNAVLASKEIEEAVATTEEPENLEEAEVVTEHVEEVALEAEAVEVAAPLEEMDISEEELMAETAEEAGSIEEVSPAEEVSGEIEGSEEISLTEDSTIIEEEQSAIAEEEGEEISSMEPVESSVEESALEDISEGTAREEVIPSQPAAELKIEPPTSEEILQIIENKVEDKVAGIFKDISLSAVEDNLKERISQKVEELVESSDINGAIEKAVEETLKISIERLAEETIPHIIEETIKTTIEEISDSLKQQVEKIIWETVPDLAETIITKEIEKIKATF